MELIKIIYRFTTKTLPSRSGKIIRIVIACKYYNCLIKLPFFLKSFLKVCHCFIKFQIASQVVQCFTVIISRIVTQK